MEYEIEDLLPLVEMLSVKYTSGDSSSVSYETARMLMEAVIYCIDESVNQENFDQETNAVLDLENKQNAAEAYKKGYEIVLNKVLRAKKIYERLIENFDDYGCRHYKDTIIKGMPEFFIWYDAKFKPQDHLLTLDYPTMLGNSNKSGVDLILEYLTEIEAEKKFLDFFDRQYVIKLLERVQMDYQSLYLDNICYLVLLNVVGCVIADQPVHKLELNTSDCKEIEFYFKDDDMEQAQIKVKSILTMVCRKLNLEVSQFFLESVSNEFAARIWYGIQNKALEGVFHINSPSVI